MMQWTDFVNNLEEL